MSKVTWLSQNLKPDVLVSNMRHLPQHEGTISPEAGTSPFPPASLPTYVKLCWDGVSWEMRQEQASLVVTLGARNQDSEEEVNIQESPGWGAIRTLSPFCQGWAQPQEELAALA